MSSFRHAVRRSRWLVILVLLCTFCYSVDANAFAATYRAARDEEARLQEMAKRLGVPVEKLRREQPGLIDALRGAFTNPEEEARKEGLARVEAQLKKMNEQVEANPYRPQIEEVKNAYQSHRLDGLLRDLTQLSTIDVVSLPVASRKALLRNVRESLKEDLEPHVPDNLPAKAKGKHNQLRGHLRALYAKLRSILDDPDAISDAKLAQTLGRIAAEVNQEVHRPERGPRFKDRPLPLQLREQTVPTQEVGSSSVGAPSSAMVPASSTSPQPVRSLTAAVVAPEIAALAQSLGSSPARIFAHVHDNIRFDPKWGAMRSPLGTLQEGEGTSWDQAWLLLDLLTAAGVEARVEWGQIEIPTSLLLTLTGTSDPFDAGNLLSTGGVPAVLLTQGGKVVGARLGHAWVKARLDYIPDRGVKPGTPDTWVRMDPSLKRYGFAVGIDVHSHVPFDLGGYLQSGTELSPRRSYEDALFAYIRANNIDCANLEQLKKAAQVVGERFPFVPGTLRGKILRVDGEQPAVPEAFQQRLTLEVKTAAGAALLTWSAPAPAVYGKRVEIDYAGATSEDQATLDAYGGVFETPPYLVDLKPVARLAGATVAQGSAVGSAVDTEVWVTMAAPAGPPTVVTHVTSAGERHILAADFGEVPQPVLDAHLAALTAAKAAGNVSEEEAETLFLIGAQYLHNLGRDLTDLSGWKWQRLVRLGTEGLISQTGVVATTVGGAPISFRRGQRNVDIALMPLGMVPADGRRQFRREAFALLGAQSSFLEGEVFNQVLQREGIASVSALTRSKRAGQTLTRVDSANVDAVLAQADLGVDAEAEIKAGIARGRIGWLAQSRISVHRWTGTGYVLEDPSTGATAYMISGGFAGGDETGEDLTALQDLLGSEPWLEGGLLGEALQMLIGLLGGGGGAGDGGGGEPSTQKSDPINLSTGNLWRAETDTRVQARGLPVVWSRTYNSRSNFNGALGFGWTFSYGERLEEQLDGSVLYREADGTEHVFTRVGSGGYLSPPGKHLVLLQGASEFSLRSKEGMISTFALDGRLLSISDTNSNTVSLGYDASGNLRTVTDAAGRTVLTVTTADGKIIRVTDLAGRSIGYSYSVDNLTAVTDTLGKVWNYAYDGDNNLVSSSDPLGNTDGYAYDTLDRCFRHVDALGFEETFSYARRGERAALTDRRGFDTYLEFDDRGRATLEVDPLGNASRSAWDGNNNRISTNDPRGGVKTQTFDERGNLLSETNALGQTTAYTYDPDFSRVLTATDAANHTVANVYDDHGNRIETRQNVGEETLVETYRYDAFGQMNERRDANDNPTAFAWDSMKGSLVSQTDALNQTTQITTDSLGRVTAITDFGGNTVDVAWDEKDHIVAATDPFDNTTRIAYDDAGRRTSTTSPRGTTTTTFDTVGRVIQVTDVLGHVTRREYDAAGNLTATIDARGGHTTMTYDANGRLLTMVDPLGGTWSYSFCAEIGGGSSAGSATESFCELVDPEGNTTKQEFDILARVTVLTDPLGNTTRTSYDELGRRVAVTDALNHATRYEYDALGRLTAVVEANQARTEYRYDRTGNLVSVKDAEGRTWPRTFDVLNRLKTESDPLGHTTAYTYDALGNVVTKLTPSGDLIQYEYDVRRQTAVVLPNGSRETFDYDTAGRRIAMANNEVSISYAYDQVNRVTRSTDHTLNQAITHEYDTAGNRTRMIGPEGAVTYLYDAKNRLVQQTDPIAGTFRFGYDSLDRRTELRFPNGIVTTYEYDSASRLVSLLTRNNQGQVVDGYHYTYDAVGNQTEVSLLQEPVTHRYQYDSTYRLTRWERGINRFEQYAYDHVGNRQGLSDENGSVIYSYDNANRLLSETRQLAQGSMTTTYSWDNNGNLLSRVAGSAATNFEWDALNRLIQCTGATGVSSYGYGPDGIRVRETANTVSKRLLHSMEDIVGVYEAGTLTSYYAHGPGTDEPLAQAIRTDGTSYLHQDGLGSVTALSAPSGQMSGAVSYAAFGGSEAADGATSRYGYTGRELDLSGLMYYRARYYEPQTGLFISRDPIQGNNAVPPTLHGYVYARNNPTNFIDPAGTTAIGIPLAVLAAVTIFVTVSAVSSERPDLWAHFLGGFALGFGLTAIGIGRFGGLGFTIAYILALGVVLNFLLEDTVLGHPFDVKDFHAQNLGLAAAVAIWLLIAFFTGPFQAIAAESLLWLLAAVLLVGCWGFVVRAIGQAKAYGLRQGLGAP